MLIHSEFNAGVVPARFVAPSPVHEEPLTGDAIKLGDAIRSTTIVFDSAWREVKPDDSESSIKLLQRER